VAVAVAVLFLLVQLVVLVQEEYVLFTSKQLRFT